MQVYSYVTSFAFFSGGEIMVIVFLSSSFGADAIPGIARTVGKLYGEFHKATDDIKREITDHTSGLQNEFGNLKDKIEKKGGDFTRKIDEELK